MPDPDWKPRPARGTRPPFKPGNELAVTHGAYTPARIGARADLVRHELSELHPHLNGPENSVLLMLAASAVATVELSQSALESQVISEKTSPRLIEALSTARRAALDHMDRLFIGPKASLERLQMQANTAATMASLTEHVPAVLDAIDRSFARIGLAGRAEEFRRIFAEELAGLDDGD